MGFNSAFKGSTGAMEGGDTIFSTVMQHVAEQLSNITKMGQKL